MLLLLLEKLSRFGWHIPAVFTYFSTRMALALITSMLFVILFGKGFIAKLYAMKIGERVRKEDCPLLGELHEAKTDTPTMGGILILFSLLVSLFLWMDLSSPFTLILLMTTLVMGGVGALDDALKLRYQSKKGLAPRKKTAVQLLLSFVLALYLLYSPFTELVSVGNWFSPPQAKEFQVESDLSDVATLTTHRFASRFYVPFLKKPLFEAHGPMLFLMALFFVLVITGSSNAVNLTDGLDGLATGTVMFAAMAFAIIAFVSNHFDLARYLHILYIEGSGEIAIYLSALVGACLGFLWFNSYPAQVFMGDTGSLTMGAILGVSAVLLRREVLLAIVGGVFVVEALSVILQVGSFRLRNKRRVFLCAPLHHHFEYKGWAEPKVVIRFWIVGLMLAIVGVASLKFQ